MTRKKRRNMKMKMKVSTKISLVRMLLRGNRSSKNRTTLCKAIIKKSRLIHLLQVYNQVHLLNLIFQKNS